MWQLGQECEANPPYLQQTDAWGHRVDKLVTCPGTVLYSTFTLQYSPGTVLYIQGTGLYFAVLSIYCSHGRSWSQTVGQLLGLVVGIIQKIDKKFTDNRTDEKIVMPILEDWPIAEKIRKEVSLVNYS